MEGGLVGGGKGGRDEEAQIGSYKMVRGVDSTA